MDIYITKDIFDQQGARAVLNKLKNLYDFTLMQESENWMVENCKNHQQLKYAFQLFLQRAINKGRNKSNVDDFDCITKNIDFSVLHYSYNHLIGCVDTLGIINEKIEKISIRSCAIPVKRGKGVIASIQKLPIYYSPVKKLIKNFNIYIKIYPQIPKEDNQWEAALITAIYSSIFNKKLAKSSMVLGGITKQGNITPIYTERLDVLGNMKSTIFMSYDNKSHIDTRFMPSFDFIYLHHIDEIISMFREIEEMASGRKYKDFLCE